MALSPITTAAAARAEKRVLNIDLWGLRECDLLDAFTFPETKFRRRIHINASCDLGHTRTKMPLLGAFQPTHNTPISLVSAN